MVLSNANFSEQVSDNSNNKEVRISSPDPILAPGCFEDVLDQFTGEFKFVTFDPYALYPENEFYGVGVINFGPAKQYCGFQAPDGSFSFTKISESEFLQFKEKIVQIASKLGLEERDYFEDIEEKQGEVPKLRFGFDHLKLKE